MQSVQSGRLKVPENAGFRIAVISGKLGDVDGVSLETDKWIDQLQALGHNVTTIAGRYADPLESIPAESQILLESIRFDSPAQKACERMVFPHLSRKPPVFNAQQRDRLVEEMELAGRDIAQELFGLLQERSIDLLIAQNTNAMPMTLLGGLSVNELVTRRRMATVFHHHDFWWERSRFSHNYIETLLNRIMPPAEVGTEHVVLTSYAAHILRSFKRVEPAVIPNCEDFENTVHLDEYNSHFRSDLGFEDSDILVVQPTRIVRRKRIEDSLKLLGRLAVRYPRLGERIRYLVSLYQGDERDPDYVEEIKETARRLNIRLHLISERVAARRGRDSLKRRVYTNRDVIANADVVTYLPIWEGFGNALLETIACRKPLVTTTYLVYKTDIKVTGLENIEIRDNYDRDGRLVIPDSAVEELHQLLTRPDVCAEMVERNFQIASHEFGLPTLQGKLESLLADYGDEIRACRQRLRKSKRSYSV
jgi:glycosyltransferase involved in cell wall biosynthesis